LATNIPQTGHLSLGEGLAGFLSSAHAGEKSVSVSVRVSISLVRGQYLI
jgi:hypothetical protein